MAAQPWRRFAQWMAAAIGICLALALQDTAVYVIDLGTDPRMRLKLPEEAPWFVIYYAMWAVLTPLIFASARRVPISRQRWAAPVAFHIAVSVAVSATVPTLLYFLFCAVWRGEPLAVLLGPSLPFWASAAAARAIIDPITYWMILAAGFALCAFDDNRERQRNAAELHRALIAAQVEALKMKLQPHFLFNTLNSISFLAVEKDVGGVVAMVERLAALLRSSIQVAGSQLVAVREELALADQYLAIEEVRFTDRLRVTRRIAPGAVDALIPSLVLQPMIENSIKHGFSRRIDASRIDVAIRRDGDSLVVTVADDGPGVPPGWDLATHCGRGLKNVIERLEKIYPGEWGFTIRNQPQGGAIARLRIPWQEQPEAAPEPVTAVRTLAPAAR
jgi:two-component system LytT family sensor kinase